VADAAPALELCTHGRREHLAAMLTEVLQPAAVVTRYAAATDAVRAIPGPWHQGGLFAINGRIACNHHLSTVGQALRDRGLCDDSPESAAHPTTLPPPARVRSERPGAPATPSHGLHALSEGLIAALSAASGSSAQSRRSYTSIGDEPIWAFIQQRADAIQVKFRVAPPYRTAEAVSGRLVEAGVVAHVGEVRARAGSTRLGVWLRGLSDLAALQRELPTLWRDYCQLR
jgi:hypothetical protein